MKKGLAAMFQYRQRYQEGYNRIRSTNVRSAIRFQYRQRYQEGYNIVTLNKAHGKRFGFNTDNGIRRATIRLL